MNKYKLILRNEDTLEDKTVCNFTLKWFYILSTVSVFTLMGLSFWMFNTIFSKWVNPLHYYNISSEKFIQMSNTIQELETHAKQHEQYIAMLQSVIRGQDISALKPIGDNVKLNTHEDDQIIHTSTETKHPSKNEEDCYKSENKVRTDNYSNNTFSETKDKDANTNIILFPPTDGNIIFRFNGIQNPYKNGITLKAQKNSPICCIADGVVIYAGLIENQNIYITIVQHRKSMLSIYKHISKPLRSVGNKLCAGDIITIIDAPTEEVKYNFSFELWIDCIPSNPEDYIPF